MNRSSPYLSRLAGRSLIIVALSLVAMAAAGTAFADDRVTPENVVAPATGKMYRPAGRSPTFNSALACHRPGSDPGRRTAVATTGSPPAAAAGTR